MRTTEDKRCHTLIVKHGKVDSLDLCDTDEAIAMRFDKKY
jgi:hypothetical protein